jgi:hypothetical protein
VKEILIHTNPLYRHGAGEARGAHNSEDTRSKRVAGIIINSHQCIKALRAPTGQETLYRCSSAAERLTTPFATISTLEVCFVNGYRLISGRSQDRNLSPVLSSNRTSASRHLEHSQDQQNTYRCGAEEARCKTPSSTPMTFGLI